MSKILRYLLLVPVTVLKYCMTLIYIIGHIHINCIDFVSMVCFLIKCVHYIVLSPTSFYCQIDDFIGTANIHYSWNKATRRDLYACIKVSPLVLMGLTFPCSYMHIITLIVLLLKEIFFEAVEHAKQESNL